MFAMILLMRKRDTSQIMSGWGGICIYITWYQHVQKNIEQLDCLSYVREIKSKLQIIQL